MTAETEDLCNTFSTCLNSCTLSLRNTEHITRPVTETGYLAEQRLAHHTKNLNVKLFANATAANANPNAGGSTIALPGLRPGELINSNNICSIKSGGLG